MELFFEIHKDLPREGPGNDESTRKALEMLTQLPINPVVIDIACGPGMQTIELARTLKGSIVAVDNHQPFLDQLNQKMHVEKGLTSIIKTINGSMLELDFAEGSFDLIWSEGAIYIIGFEEGLKKWRPLLKKGGYIAVTELSWLRQELPKELEDYWKTEYPGICSVEDNRKIIKNLGLSLIGDFILPQAAWWDNYYSPLKQRIDMLRAIYKGDEEMNHLLDIEDYEIDLFSRYADYFGFVFYVMQAK